jgi:hypothetical protein
MCQTYFRLSASAPRAQVRFPRAGDDTVILGPTLVAGSGQDPQHIRRESIWSDGLARGRGPNARPFLDDSERGVPAWLLDIAREILGDQRVQSLTVEAGLEMVRGVGCHR